MPPVLCLTATAKPDVIADITAHFAEKVGVDLRCIDGGARRDNLAFDVLPTTPAEKLAHIHELLAATLPPDAPGGATVYCATRRNSEEVSAFLTEKGLVSAHFHARLPPETKKNVQEAFIRGDLRKDGEVITTPGEILVEEVDAGFERDSATDDTRVRTAVCWLEEAGLLTREENRVQIFPSSLRVGSVTEARERLARIARRREQAPEQADAQRDRLLGGFRWILVEEYQDIGPRQYELIGALAGRSRSDEDTRLNLFAVGDD